MVFSTVCTSKSVSILSSIIKTEELDVTCKLFVDALGDSIIKVIGEAEDIKILKEIFEMVA